MPNRYELVKLTTPVGGSPVRVVTDHLDNNFYVANDVAAALGYTNIEKAISDNCKKTMPLSSLPIEHNISRQDIRSNANMITEADMYRLIFSSRLASAELFQDWVFNDVLPSLRKQGEYTKSDMQVAQAAMQAASSGGTDFETEIASLKASLALARQEAHEAQAKLQNTVFQISVSKDVNKAEYTDWRLRFEPLRCAHGGRADRWGEKHTPKMAVAALGDYVDEALDLIRTALQFRPALVFALKQSGIGIEVAYKVADNMQRYARKQRKQEEAEGGAV